MVNFKSPSTDQLDIEFYRSHFSITHKLSGAMMQLVLGRRADFEIFKDPLNKVHLVLFQEQFSAYDIPVFENTHLYLLEGSKLLLVMPARERSRPIQPWLEKTGYDESNLQAAEAWFSRRSDWEEYAVVLLSVDLEKGDLQRKLSMGEVVDTKPTKKC
jgi:hypothetical protein